MLDDFDCRDFTAGGTTHPVRRAGSGPPVVVIHEVPGITPTVAAFAETLLADGFTVLLPELFGTTGRPKTMASLGASTARVCISREFRLLGARSSSPVTDWLRALARSAHDDAGGSGVGVVGMCVTGNFALTMMADPWVMAPVLSQPSLPVVMPWSKRNSAALHVTDSDLAAAKRRSVDEGVCLLGLRFTEDKLCPPERFERLADEFGSGFEAIEIDSGPDNPHGIGRMAHSVLTEELVDRPGHPTAAARDRVLRFLHEQLDPR